MFVNLSTESLRATVDGVTFTLRQNGCEYRWFYPDWTPTDLIRDDVPAAQRAMMFQGQNLAREYHKMRAGVMPQRVCPVCGSDESKLPTSATLPLFTNFQKP